MDNENYIHSETGETFTKAFSVEILRVERHRATILAAVLTFSLMINVCLMLFTDVFPATVARSILIVLAIAICYELIGRAVLKRFIAANRDVPMPARYFNALVETSLPTFVLIIVAKFQGPENALQGNISLFYAVFIMLSTLRLQFGLSAWTGVVAAVQYLGVWLYLSRSHPELLVMSATLSAVRGCIALLLLGVVAGFVSLQIRDRVRKSLRLVAERNRVINLFGQHLSPVVVERLLSQRTGDATEIRYVCMMFLDIRNFTTFSESTNPSVVINYLNTLFASMIDIVNRHHGIINKFLGDGFMAVFGAPLSHENDCQYAVEASHEILMEVERMVQTGAIPPTRVGIGLHAGEAITGNVGSAVRKEYTIIGDVVNVAARIEQLNKQFDSRLLVSDTVRSALEKPLPDAIAIEPLQLRGRQQAVQLWKLA